MKFEHRMQRLEAQRPKKRDLTGVPVEDMTDEEIDGEIYRITGKRPPPMSEMTDEELAELKEAWLHNCSRLSTDTEQGQIWLRLILREINATPSVDAKTLSLYRAMWQGSWPNGCTISRRRSGCGPVAGRITPPRWSRPISPSLARPGYTHIGMYDLTSSVNSLPSIGVTSHGAEGVLKATGTENLAGSEVPTEVPRGAENGAILLASNTLRIASDALKARKRRKSATP